jgi:hypothetical protein
MSVTAAAPEPLAPVRGWIIDRRSDLLWLLGSVGVSYAFVAAHAGLGVPAVALWWTWIVAFDGPHVFATLFRTYLDRQERLTRAPLLAGSLGFFALGPAMFGLSALLGSALPFHLFLAFASVWAYWHVVRQHYGFMVLYKKKNGDMAPADNRVDNALLYVGQLAPFAAFAVTQQESRRMLGLSGPITWEGPFASACWAALGVAALLFAARQADLLLRGRAVNGPKVLFFLAVVPLAALVFSPWVAQRSHFIAFFAYVTAFHNVQYHAIVWFYARNRYGTADAAQYGAASTLARAFWRYALAGVLFTLAYRLFGCSLGVHPGCGAFAWTDKVAAGLTWTHLGMGFMWGFALQHYYLDQKIWKLRKDRALNEALKLPG